MAFTRKSHQVRVKHPSTPEIWADVEVLDAVALRLPNGKEVLYQVPAAVAVACIRDDTGDGQARGQPQGCSRVSHMVRLTNPDDESQFFDVEVLDAFALRGPNGEEIALLMPEDGAREAIVDDTGSGVGIPASANTTRVLRAVKIAELVDGPGSTASDDPAYPSGEITDNFALSLRTEALAMRGPNGAESVLLIPAAGSDANDTTSYTFDDQGNKVPPDNSDPNVYVYFPEDSAGPWLGAGAPIKQGPLWWIKRLNGTQAFLVLEFLVTRDQAAADPTITATVLPATTVEQEFPVASSDDPIRPPDAPVFELGPVQSRSISANVAPQAFAFSNPPIYTQVSFRHVVFFNLNKIENKGTLEVTFSATDPARTYSASTTLYYNGDPHQVDGTINNAGPHYYADGTLWFNVPGTFQSEPKGIFNVPWASYTSVRPRTQVGVTATLFVGQSDFALTSAADDGIGGALTAATYRDENGDLRKTVKVQKGGGISVGGGFDLSPQHTLTFTLDLETYRKNPSLTVATS
jgi:hypothetical protein